MTVPSIAITLTIAVSLLSGQIVLRCDTSEQGQSDRFGKPTTQAPLPPGHRRVQKQRGQPIDAQVRPDDNEVILLDFGWSDLSAVPEGQSALSIMIAASDFVGVGRVTRMNGRLTEQGDDIESVVTISVSEVLKGNPTDTQTFVFPDGEVRIGKTRVRVERPGAFPLVPKDTVLVFASIKDGELRTNHRGTFRIANNQVTPLMQGHPLTDTRDVAIVLERAREAATALRKR